jgi:hypothetical protein
MPKLIKNAADWAGFFRARIAALGLSHFEVDQRAGLADGYTNKIVNGKKLPGAATIECLCRELKISLRPVADDETENCALEDCDNPKQRGDTGDDQRSDLHVETGTGCSPIGNGVARGAAGEGGSGQATARGSDPEDPVRRDPGAAHRGRRMNEVLERPGIVSMKPPVATKPAVRAHCRTLELERDAIRAGAVALASASAKGDPAAREALAVVPARLAALQFEIDLNRDCQEIAEKEDAAAQVAWRSAIQAMDAAEIVAGIGKESCCGRCMPGIPGGCVLTASVPHAGSTCSHPIKERHLFHRDEFGRRIFPHRDNPHASRVFGEACRKLNVRGEFS